MRLHQMGLLLLVVVEIGCGSTRSIVRMDTGWGETIVHIPRSTDFKPVLVEKEEFQQVVPQLAREVWLTGTPRETAEKAFQLDPLSGNYLYLLRDKKLVPMGPGEPLQGTLTKEDLETAEHYRLWCQRVHDFYGDCLGGALVGGRYLDLQGRYVWALAMSKSPVLDEMKQALGDMVNLRAVMGAALWMGTSIMKLTDAANEVPIPGHKGPHPQRYHEIVFNRLSEALRSCRSVEACRERS
jgi:hypothetical protein